MRHYVSFAVILAVLVQTVAVRAQPAAGSSLVPLPTLDSQARARIGATPRFALAPAASDVFKGLEPGTIPDGEEVPNYLRALAVLPNTVASFAHVFHAVLY